LIFFEAHVYNKFMEKNELKSLIIRRFGTQGACAKALGWYESKLSQIMQGWTPPEPDRKALAEALEIPVEEIFSL
jgi:hypothetical protein